MRTWVFNDGSYKHRGVWHVAEGELKLKVVPESSREHEVSIHVYHGKNCSGRQEYVYDGGYGSAGPGSRVTYKTGSYKWVGCDCDLDTDAVSGLAGSYTIRTITPEHRELKGQTVLCHQVVISDSEAGYFWSRKKGKDGEVVVDTAPIKPLNMWVGDRPPGPVCSRCLTGAERRGI